MITKQQLKELEKKLIYENRTSIYLNSCLSKDSNSKIDLFTIPSINFEQNKNFHSDLFRTGSVIIKSGNQRNEGVIKYEKFKKNLQGVLVKTRQISRNKGVESLKIGYPIISYLTNTSQADCFLAPLFLLDLQVKITNTQIEFITNGSFNFNPSLLTAIGSNALPLQIENTIKNINDGQDIISVTNNFIDVNSAHLSIVHYSNLNKIPYQSKTDLFSKTENLPKIEIHSSGIVSNFMGSNIGIINDLKAYSGGIGPIKPFDFKINSFPFEDLDPSQQNVVETLNKGKHLIIHGPPGTGKSQTITGIISSALAQKKTVLVVCEKRAALDVINANLTKNNLQSFVRVISNIDTDQYRIIREIRQNAENIGTRNPGNLDVQTFDKQSQTTSGLSTLLVQNKEILSRNIIHNHRWKDLVGKYLKNKSFVHIVIAENKIRYWIENFESSLLKSKTAVDLCSNLTNYEIIRNNLNLRFGFNQISTDIHLLRESLLSATSTKLQINDVERNSKNLIFAKHNKLEEALRIKINEYDSFIKIEEILKQKFLDENLTLTKIKDYNISKINIFLESLKNLRNELESDAHFLLEIDISEWLDKKFNLLQFLKNKDYRITWKKIKIIKQNKLIQYNNFNIDNISRIIQRINELELLTRKLEEICGNDVRLYKQKHNKERFQTELILNKLNALIVSQNEIALNEIDPKWGISEFIEYQESIIRLRKIESEIRQSQILTPNAKELYDSYHDGFNSLINNLIEYLPDIESTIRLRSILDDLFGNSELSPTIDFCELFYSKLSKYLTDKYYVENKTHLIDVDSLLQQTKSSTNIARENSNKLAKKFLYDSFKGGMTNSTEFNKIFALGGRNKKSLREIATLHTNVFLSCCPVLLTTPDVVSTLFKGQSDVYDLIIFDEASQIEIHNSIGAFQKGKAKIVAGDQHQMPPSTYFLRKSNIEDFDNTENIEDGDLLESSAFMDVESLLDFCISNKNDNFESKYLDFHYRSEHPGLIRFSNEAIYKRLVIKPTRDIQYKPFEFKHVNNSTWFNGENIVEANNVIEVLDTIQINDDNVPSIIIGTLNMNQANLIIKLIINKRTHDSVFERKFIKLESKGFSVVNLEHLQGDECDIMIMSTGYGLNNDGKFRSQFIFSGERGYRLLNVAVTRARYKLILVTSIPKSIYKDYFTLLSNEDINTKTKGLFYAYINYVEAYSQNNEKEVDLICQNLRKYFLNNNGSLMDFNDGEFESPFEEEVYSSLLSRFDQSEITLQENHKDSGFRIDMVIRPSGFNGLKIAIECDGATFHSGWSNQLLDAHRQKLLERADFKFVRIWSKDWWQNQETAERKLLLNIQQIMINYEANNTQNLNWLNDLIQTPEQTEFVEGEILEEIIDEINEVVESPVSDQSLTNTIQTSEKLRTVDSNSIVNLKVNNATELIVSISDYPQIDTDNGIKNIRSYSPLARLLYGKSIGQIANFNDIKYEVLDII
jgi:superfamily I DNA and/or RNA helicase